jgi:hypothetical protein
VDGDGKTTDKLPQYCHIKARPQKISSTTAKKTSASAKCIQSIWKEIKNRYCSLTFAWIEVHSSIRGNKETDRAEKLPAGLPATMSIKPSVTTKKGLDEHTKKMWQRQYSSPKTTSGKFCKKHSPTTLLCPAIFGESRSKQVTLSKVHFDKLNLNHKRFQENLHPMGPSDTCYKSESTDHVLMEFPRYGEESRDIHKNIVR